jgi:hypothetical protein
MRAIRFGIVLVAVVSATANAGEIESGIVTCEVRGIFQCGWKPKGCYKPLPPSTFVVDVTSYNLAVDAYNRYLSDVRRYLACAVNDGKSDIESFPEIVKRGIEKTSQEMDREIASAKSSLDRARIFLPR